MGVSSSTEHLLMGKDLLQVLMSVTELMQQSVADILRKKDDESPLTFLRKILIAQDTAQGMNWMVCLFPSDH